MPVAPQHNLLSFIVFSLSPFKIGRKSRDSHLIINPADCLTKPVAWVLHSHHAVRHPLGTVAERLLTTFNS
jgi:hypothetical protein